MAERQNVLSTIMLKNVKLSNEYVRLHLTTPEICQPRNLSTNALIKQQKICFLKSGLTNTKQIKDYKIFQSVFPKKYFVNYSKRILWLFLEPLYSHFQPMIISIVLLIFFGLFYGSLFSVAALSACQWPQCPGYFTLYNSTTNNMTFLFHVLNFIFFLYNIS